MIMQIILVLLATLVATSNVQNLSKYKHGTLLCDYCPPSMYWLQHCSATEQTKCAFCLDGQYTDKPNRNLYCKSCTNHCGVNMKVVKICAKEHNILCVCNDGFWLRDHTLYNPGCIPHSKCSAGQGVVRLGTPTNDTQCQTCPDGTFSNVSSATEKCMQGKGPTNSTSNIPWQGWVAGGVIGGFLFGVFVGLVPLNVLLVRFFPDKAAILVNRCSVKEWTVRSRQDPAQPEANGLDPAQPGANGVDPAQPGANGVDQDIPLPLENAQGDLLVTDNQETGDDFFSDGGTPVQVVAEDIPIQLPSPVPATPGTSSETPV